MVRPGDSTTFDIVFLPRRVGRVGTVLYIHTSLGTFKYEVCMSVYVCVCVCVESRYCIGVCVAAVIVLCVGSTVFMLSHTPFLHVGQPLQCMLLHT